LTEHRKYDATHLEGITRQMVREATHATQCGGCDEYVEDSNMLHHITVECQRGGRSGEERIHTSGILTHRCDSCAISFPNDEALQDHIYSSDCTSVRHLQPTNDPDARPGRERFVCEACNEDFSTADDLRVHEFVAYCGRERIREDSQTFFHCDECESYFTFQEDFLTHFQGCGISVAPKDEINETSARSTSPENAKSGGGRVFECPVCMEEQSHLSSVPCGHLFCTSCIRAALKADKRCPVCRSSARETDLRRTFLNGSG